MNSTRQSPITSVNASSKMRKQSNLLEALNGGQNGKMSFTERTTGRILEYYVVGEIEEASEYVDWFDAIRHANESDVVKIYINSFGGDLFTAIQFMRVLRETRASVIASVEGACMSAATIIFLSATDYEVSRHSNFMFHNYSGGTFGKGGEMMDQLVYERKWSEALLRDVYADFLTPEEITAILDNKDIWLDSEKVVERLNKRLESRRAAAEAQKSQDSPAE